MDKSELDMSKTINLNHSTQPIVMWFHWPLEKVENT